jgi:enoyl-CoA hydratase
VLLTDVDGPVATVTLNRPEARNALSAELTRAIQDAVRELDGRDDIAAIILTGADPAFCAGVDLKQLASGERPARVVGLEKEPPFFGPLPAHDTPVIGAVNGPAVTGGLELVLACDFVIASERAKFADTHARVGVMPGWGLTVRLPALIGMNRARQMSFTGDYVDAQLAYEWGLANEVVAHEELLPRAREIAAHIATIPADHVREIRSMYAEVEGLSGDAAWARESELSRAWMKSRFDQARLAREREAIVDRGRSQQ